MGLTTDEENRAKLIVEQWFWQMAEGHNYRFAHATKSMTLFYESAPLEADALKLVIEYLQARTGLTELVVNHKRLTFDVGWDTKDAWYQTVPGENWAGTESSKVRLYWVLVQTADGTGDGPYTVENGCKYKVEHKFFWDVKDAPTADDVTSSSGVQKSIQGLTRDRETGLYSYVIETRTTVEQDIELYDTSVTAFETVQEAQYLGVKASDVAEKGLAASAGGGVLVERRISKNPDCTSDVVNRKITEKKVETARKVTRKTLRGTVETVTDRNLTDSEVTEKTTVPIAVGETRTTEKTPGGLVNLTVEKTTAEAAGEIASESGKTIFEHRDTVTENVATDPGTADASTAADGTIEQVSVRKTEEGTFDVTTQTTKEQKVENARKVTRKTLRGTVEAVTDRNLTDSEVTEKTTVPIAVGETRTTEKTPGGLTDLTIESATPDTAKRTLSESCERTSAVHTDIKVETMDATDPDAEIVDTGSDPTTKVTPNNVKRVTVRHNDDGVMVDKETLNTVYEEQTSSATSDYGGVESVETTRKSHATTEAAIVPEDRVGGKVPPNKVIEVDNQPNDHGSHTTMKRVTTYQPIDSRPANGTAANDVKFSDDEYDYFQRAFANQLTPLLPTAQEIAGGRVSLTFHPNGHGSWDGAYTLRKARTDYGSGAVGKLIIDEGKNVQYSKTRRWGEWSYAIVGTITWIYWVWEFRRVCSYRFRVIGLTESQADSLVTSLSSSYTRSIKESLQDLTPSYQDGGGYFVEQSAGEALMTKIFKYHIEGDVWGVRVMVNEQSVKLRGQNQGYNLSPGTVFSTENNWSYPTSGSST